jgi:hypothetical protein
MTASCRTRYSAVTFVLYLGCAGFESRLRTECPNICFPQSIHRQYIPVSHDAVPTFSPILRR